MSAVLLASSGAYGAYLGGHARRDRSKHHRPHRVCRRSGQGGRQSPDSEIDILDRLELDGWTSLIGFDVRGGARADFRPAWIEAAAVRKVYPHTLEVRVDEREAFALWQQGDKLSVIEKNGAVIAPFSGGKQVLLPLLIGTGAPAMAPDFLARMEKYPELASRVKAYVRVGERRWDLKLDNGITVKLPEDGEDQAVAELVGMDRDNGFVVARYRGRRHAPVGPAVVQLTPRPRRSAKPRSTRSRRA